jgi:transposase
MASLVYLKNKKNGVTYVYKNVSKWNKQKQRSENERQCIGKLDPETKEIVPTGKRGLGNGQRAYANAAIIGNHILFEKIASDFGLRKVLELSFPEVWDKILTCAYYLLSERKALSHCESWSTQHENPCGGMLRNQRISDLLLELTPTKQMTFFRNWVCRRQETEYFALDITSVSSYSEQNEYVRNGYNRDKENLPQVNLCMLLGEKSGIPIYYDVLPGSIRDVSALKNVLITMNWLDAKRLHLVMDKGFYSEANIDAMYESHLRFTAGVPFTINWAKDFVASKRGGIETLEHYRRIGEGELFVDSELSTWKGHRCYRHVYYDSRKAAEEYAEFLRRVSIWKEELEGNKPIKEHQSYYDKYFIVKKTPKRGRKVIVRDEIVQEFKEKTTGFFVLLSNDIKDPDRALLIYRGKDAVEKGFDDLKNALDSKRLRIHSPLSMKGRFFLQFIALIISAGIRKVMEESGLGNKCTMPEIINEMKSFQRVVVDGHRKALYTKLTKFQLEILEAFGLKSNSYV